MLSLLVSTSFVLAFTAGNANSIQNDIVKTETPAGGLRYVLKTNHQVITVDISVEIRRNWDVPLEAIKQLALANESVRFAQFRKNHPTIGIVSHTANVHVFVDTITQHSSYTEFLVDVKLSGEAEIGGLVRTPKRRECWRWGFGGFIFVGGNDFGCILP